MVCQGLGLVGLPGMTSLKFGPVLLALPPTNDSDDARYSISQAIWPASLVLCEYLSQHPDLVKGTRVVDLGGGRGIASAVASLLGAQHVCIQELAGQTDLSVMQDSLMQVNGIGKHRYSQWDYAWGDPIDNPSVFDLLVSSDTFYDVKHFEDLVVTVAQLLRQNPSAQFITAYHDRDAEYYIGDLLEVYGLRAEILPLPLMHQGNIEAIRSLRRMDDPEEWPTDLASTIFLLRITNR